jgi:hypothetical protein
MTMVTVCMMAAPACLIPVNELYLNVAAFQSRKLCAGWKELVVVSAAMGVA